MKKFLIVLLVLAMMASFAACGEGEKEDKPVVLDLSAMYAQMEPSLPEMAALSESAMLNRYGISTELVDEAYVYVSMDGLLADEIWLLKATDDAALTKLESLAQTRLQSKDEESVTYSPEQNKIVKQGKILKRGNYLALIVAPEVDEFVAIFKG